MGLSDLTSREAVLRAIEEYKRSKEDFLKTHGFGKAKSCFVLDDEGNEYASKAIAGVAHGYQFPAKGPLKSAEFNGGEKTVKPKLESLGFEVIVRKS